MTKRATTFELMLPARDPAIPAYRWLYDTLRSEILEGRLRSGDRLPSTRDLSTQYGLSRGTIVFAFEQLASEGYTEGRTGSGTHVSSTLPDDLLRMPVKAVTAAPTPSRLRRRLAAQGRRVAAFPVLENRASRAFRPNLPALDLFPTTLWAQVTARRLRRASTNLLLGCGPMGYRPLQEAVAAYYDSEFRYTGRPVPALQGLDRGAHVLFAGSFSKLLFPSLRIGYLVLPRDLIERVAAFKSITSRHPPVVEQAVLCDFISAGHFARHLRRMRQVYGERLAALLDGARQHLAGLLEVSKVEAGLQTAGWLAPGLDSESAAQAAATRGVEVTPLGRYSRSPLAREGLQLGFAAVDKAEIRRGVRELARALELKSKARP